MDKIIIDNSYMNEQIEISKDSYIVIDKDVQAKKIVFNIMDCKVKVLDMSDVCDKTFNFVNSDGVIVGILNSSFNKIKINNRKSSVEFNVIDLFNENINCDINCIVDSKESVCDMNIASVSYNNAVKNYSVYTENNDGNSVNKINCFGIVKDESSLNYDVSSFIKQGAKKSVVRQNSKILLLDEKSEGKNNPILLIEENDVKASHGSSIGKIDDETMFYLCSRGLTKNEATHLICLGKLESLISKIDDEEVKEVLISRFKERMS